MTITLSRTSLVLSVALAFAGCADPAADKFKAVTAAPKEVPAAVPADSGTSDRQVPLTATGSTVAFTGSKVTGSHSGGFRTFKGTADLSPDGSSLEKLSVEIDMSSIFTDNDKLTGHLQSPDFFDVKAHPTSTFTTTSITAGGKDSATHTITGNLTLHGVTKSITFPATVTVHDREVRVVSEFALNRKDFGVSYAGKTDDLIRDQVVLKIDVKGKKS